jgi:hypothetical protein
MNQLENLSLLLSFARSAKTIDHLIECARLELTEPEFFEFEIVAQRKLYQLPVPSDLLD